jgi:hypothetical protein
MNELNFTHLQVSFCHNLDFRSCFSEFGSLEKVRAVSCQKAESFVGTTFTFRQNFLSQNYAEKCLLDVC